MSDFNTAFHLRIKAEETQDAWNCLNKQSFLLDRVQYYLHVATDERASEETREDARVKCDEYLNTAGELRLRIMEELAHSRRLPSADTIAELGLLDCLVMERPDDVQWDGMAHMEETETWKALWEVIHFPIKFPHLFKAKRISENVLLIGDFGVDRLRLVKAVAKKAGCSRFLYFSSRSLFARNNGNRLVVRRLFKLARLNKPCILFLDDVDRFSGCNCCPGSTARREFLSQMSDYQLMNNGVFVIGSSSIQMNLDSQILRRFEKMICKSALEEVHPSLHCMKNSTMADYELTAAEYSSSSTQGLLNGITVDHGSYRGSSLNIRESDLEEHVGWGSAARALCVGVCRPLMTIVVSCSMLGLLIIVVLVMTFSFK